MSIFRSLPILLLAGLALPGVAEFAAAQPQPYARRAPKVITWRPNVATTAHLAILGDVQRPGVYAFEGSPEQFTIQELVRRAGGLTAEASPSLRLIRQGSGDQRIFYNPQQVDALLPNDVLVIERQTERAVSQFTNDQLGQPAEKGIQVALLGLLERPVVLKLTPEQARLDVLTAQLNQAPGAGFAARVLSSGQPSSPLPQQANQASQSAAIPLHRGSVVIFDPRSIVMSNLPPLDRVITAAAEAPAQPSMAPEVAAQPSSVPVMASPATPSQTPVPFPVGVPPQAAFPPVTAQLDLPESTPAPEPLIAGTPVPKVDVAPPLLPVAPFEPAGPPPRPEGGSGDLAPPPPVPDQPPASISARSPEVRAFGGVPVDRPMGDLHNEIHLPAAAPVPPASSEGLPRRLSSDRAGEAGAPRELVVAEAASLNGGQPFSGAQMAIVCLMVAVLVGVALGVRRYLETTWTEDLFGGQATTSEIASVSMVPSLPEETAEQSESLNLVHDAVDSAPSVPSDKEPVAPEPLVDIPESTVSADVTNPPVAVEPQRFQFLEDLLHDRLPIVSEAAVLPKQLVLQATPKPLPSYRADAAHSALVSEPHLPLSKPAKPAKPVKQAREELADVEDTSSTTVREDVAEGPGRPHFVTKPVATPRGTTSVAETVSRSAAAWADRQSPISRALSQLQGSEE